MHLPGLGILFDSDEEDSSCQLCGGKGFIHGVSKDKIPCKQPGRFIEKPVVTTCYCKLNQRIEDAYPMLRATEKCLGDQVQRTVTAMGLERNYLLFGNKQRFMRIVKSMFIHLSGLPGVQYHVANGLEIVKEYYVAQDAKSGRDILDLMRKWQFFVLIFETRTVNKALKAVISDLIRARAQNNLITWVWSEGNIDSYEEWSPELSKFFSDPDCYVVQSLTDSKVMDVSAMMSAASLRATATEEAKGAN